MSWRSPPHIRRLECRQPITASTAISAAYTTPAPRQPRPNARCTTSASTSSNSNRCCTCVRDSADQSGEPDQHAHARPPPSPDKQAARSGSRVAQGARPPRNRAVRRCPGDLRQRLPGSLTWMLPCGAEPEAKQRTVGDLDQVAGLEHTGSDWPAVDPEGLVLRRDQLVARTGAPEGGRVRQLAGFARHDQRTALAGDVQRRGRNRRAAPAQRPRKIDDGCIGLRAVAHTLDAIWRAHDRPPRWSRAARCGPNDLHLERSTPADAARSRRHARREQSIKGVVLDEAPAPNRSQNDRRNRGVGLPPRGPRSRLPLVAAIRHSGVGVARSSSELIMTTDAAAICEASTSRSETVLRNPWSKSRRSSACSAGSARRLTDQGCAVSCVRSSNLAAIPLAVLSG